MLFSNPEVTEYINRHFEPAWASVSHLPYYEREDGIQKVAAGNIATHICDSAGKVLTVLPSLYKPADYLSGLEQGRLLHDFLNGADAEFTRRFCQWYHKRLGYAPDSLWAPRFLLRDGKAALLHGHGMPLRMEQKAAQAPKQAGEIEIRQPETESAPPALKRAGMASYDGTNQYPYYLAALHQFLATVAGTETPEAIAGKLFREILFVTFLDNLCLGKMNGQGGQLASSDKEEEVFQQAVVIARPLEGASGVTTMIMRRRDVLRVPGR